MRKPKPSMSSAAHKLSNSQTPNHPVAPVISIDAEVNRSNSACPLATRFSSSSALRPPRDLNMGRDTIFYEKNSMILSAEKSNISVLSPGYIPIQKVLCMTISVFSRVPLIRYFLPLK